MKKLLTIFCFAIVLSTILNAQQQIPQLLKQPAGWQFERFTLPPVFAPNFPYHGAEELRFSPGMFSKDSTDYFTYAFVAQLDNTLSITQDDIRNYLLNYYKGLCNSTAKDRKLSIDTSKITVSLEPKNTTIVNQIIYNASLDIFGVFADGGPLKLSMEIKVLNDKAASKIYLVCIASPLEKTNNAWQILYKIQKDFVIPTH